MKTVFIYNLSKIKIWIDQKDRAASQKMNFFFGIMQVYKFFDEYTLQTCCHQNQNLNSGKRFIERIHAAYYSIKSQFNASPDISLNIKTIKRNKQDTKIIN